MIRGSTVITSQFLLQTSAFYKLILTYYKPVLITSQCLLQASAYYKPVLIESQSLSKYACMHQKMYFIKLLVLNKSPFENDFFIHEM